VPPDLAAADIKLAAARAAATGTSAPGNSSLIVFIRSMFHGVGVG
jgi:hypothetical protein